MQEVDSSVGRRFRCKARSALPQTQRKVGTSQPKWLFSSDPWAVWYGRCNILQASEASRCLSHANFMPFHRVIQEHMEDVWIKVTPSYLLEVLSSCALLPLAQSFVENFAAKLAAMADARLAKEVAESPKLCQICQRSSLWCFFRSVLVSRTVGLTSPSLIVQLRLVVAAHARGRPRSMTYLHLIGSKTSGSANVVLSTGGRLEVVQSSGVRTFQQEMWRVCVVLWRCAAPKYGE